MSNNMWIDDKSVRDLMDAIVIQAINDYKTARKTRRCHTERFKQLVAKKKRGERLADAENASIRRYLRNVSEEEKVCLFFRSQWGEALSGCDGNHILSTLEREDDETLQRHNFA